MSIKNYEGPLGSFTYDDEEFIVTQKAGVDKDILRYNGWHCNGADIHIPDGVIDLSYTFEGVGLNTTPHIPGTVTCMDYTFKGCGAISIAASLPEGLLSCVGLYQNCRALLAGSHMPSTLKNASYMYDGCWAMYEAGYYSPVLDDITCIYRDCKNLAKMPSMMPTTCRGEDAFLGCVRLDNNDRVLMY